MMRRSVTIFCDILTQLASLTAWECVTEPSYMCVKMKQEKHKRKNQDFIKTVSLLKYIALFCFWNRRLQSVWPAKSFAVTCSLLQPNNVFWQNLWVNIKIVIVIIIWEEMKKMKKFVDHKFVGLAINNKNNFYWNSTFINRSCTACSLTPPLSAM